MKVFIKCLNKFNPINKMMIDSRQSQLDMNMKYVDMLRGLEQDANITIDQLRSWSPIVGLFANWESVKQKIGRGVQLHSIKIGKEMYPFTTAELMSLAMHARNEYNMNKVARNGIATRDERIGELGQEVGLGGIDVYLQSALIKHPHAGEIIRPSRQLLPKAEYVVQVLAGCG